VQSYAHVWHGTQASAQNGRSSSSCGGASSKVGGPSVGVLSNRGAAGAARRAADAGYGLGEPSRDGQITPSQPGPPRSRGLLRHLKSGARGLRFDSRSSHIAPPHTGQSGIPVASTPPRGAVGAGGAPLDPALVDGAGTPLFAGGPADAAGAAGAPTAARPSRGGQITPSQPRSLHLKSGAFGLRLPSRLSHIGPSHLGQTGSGAD
jgi:hypothetical protein